MTSGPHDHHIGENIRRARRERNLSQTQLGGERYSKSYISAVEHAKVLPTQHALHYFAAQLHLPETFFTRVSEPASLSSSPDPSIEEPWYLLDMLVENLSRSERHVPRELPPFSLEDLHVMPASSRASYAFLLGILAQQKGEFNQALQALEYALENTQPQQRFAILDVIGSNYALQRMDSLALHYHLQAHILLKQGTFVDSSPLHLNITMHCAEDYQSLGNYQMAKILYEEACFYLRGENSMKIAMSLYLSLGYCTYALIRHIATLATPELERLTVEEIDQGYKSAINLLLDSLSISKFAGNSTAEIVARLLISLIMLDWCAGLLQKSSTMSSKPDNNMEERCTSLLDQAEEHCHHILLACQLNFKSGGLVLEEEKQIMYPVLASVVRIFSKRAAIARIEGHRTSMIRELALASSLCNHILDNFAITPDPFSSIEVAIAYRTIQGVAFTPKLPTLPNTATFKVPHSAYDQVEVYLAAGEVAEELGRTAEKPGYASDCYGQAELFFLSALSHASSVVTHHEQDPGYLPRCFQRCITILEERVAHTPSIRQESTGDLLHFFQNELQQLPDLLNPVGIHADKHNS